jgi:hypothetical protein
VGAFCGWGSAVGAAWAALTGTPEDQTMVDRDEQQQAARVARVRCGARAVIAQELLSGLGFMVLATAGERLLNKRGGGNL